MKRIIFYSSVLVLILFSCYPEGAEYYEDLDLVYTKNDNSYDFTGKSSYSMPDRIVIISGDIVDGENPEFVKEPFATQILTLVESNMGSLGWTRVSDPASADLVLMPASWSNTTIYYWYDYWCWYYPWYCGWGYYYPGGGYTTSYTTGTFVMTLVASGGNFIEPTRVWTGAINGLFSGAFNISRVTKGVDQAFEQSPYLNTN